MDKMTTLLRVVYAFRSEKTWKGSRNLLNNLDRLVVGGPIDLRLEDCKVYLLLRV